MLLTRLRHFLPVVALAAIVVVSAAGPADGASGLAAQRAQLARNEARWTAQHVQSYRFRLKIACDCPPASDRRVEITVLHGRPQGAKYFPGQLQTFPQMFRLIGQVLADPNSEAGSVRYDPHRGFPRTARLDAIGWTVDRFQPLSAH
jgi:hypothetical protein